MTPSITARTGGPSCTPGCSPASSEACLSGSSSASCGSRSAASASCPVGPSGPGSPARAGGPRTEAGRAEGGEGPGRFGRARRLRLRPRSEGSSFGPRPRAGSCCGVLRPSSSPRARGPGYGPVRSGSRSAGDLGSGARPSSGQPRPPTGDLRRSPGGSSAGPTLVRGVPWAGGHRGREGRGEGQEASALEERSVARARRKTVAVQGESPGASGPRGR